MSQSVTHPELLSLDEITIFTMMAFNPPPPHTPPVPPSSNTTHRWLGGGLLGGMKTGEKKKNNSVSKHLDEDQCRHLLAALLNTYIRNIATYRL